MAVLFYSREKVYCVSSQITVVGFIRLFLIVVLLQHSFKNQTFYMNTSHLHTKQTNQQTKTRVFYFKNSCLSDFCFCPVIRPAWSLLLLLFQKKIQTVDVSVNYLFIVCQFQHKKPKINLYRAVPFLLELRLNFMLSQIRMMVFYELLHSNGSLLFLLQHFFKNQTFNMNKRNVIIIYCIIYLKAQVHQCKRYCVLHCILHRWKIQQLPNQNAGATSKQQHKHTMSLGWTLAFKNNNDKTMVFYFQIIVTLVLSLLVKWSEQLVSVWFSSCPFVHREFLKKMEWQCASQN